LLLINNSAGSSSGPDDDASEGTTSHSRGYARDGESGDARSRGSSRGKMSKEQKKAHRGQNKGRKFGKVRDELDLCWRVANGSTCEFGAE
jgi:tRNA-dihydrouridine synthase 3